MPTPPPVLYVDLMSQPSRACYILVKAFDLPVEVRMVRLDKGEHKQAAYKAVNPLGKVPFLVHGDLKLPESAAIMGYIAATPAAGADEAARQAALATSAVYEAAAHWQHLTVRRGAMTLAFATVIGPRVFNVPASPPVAAHGLQVLKQALADLDSYWLAGKLFMTGDRLAIPDVLCCCELEQLNMMVAAGPEWPQLEQLLGPHPAIQDWMAAVRQEVGAATYDDAHSKLRAAVKRLAAAEGGR